MRCLRLVICLALLLALAGPAWAGVSITDDSGQRIQAKAPFTRIISLYGAHTENLFALGLDCQIIGVSPHESHPPAALRKPVFSYRDDPERFLAARPDLVLVRPMIMRGYPNLVAALQRAGITVVSLQPRTVDEMLAYWRKLGALTGRQAEAEALARRFTSELAAIKARVAGVPRSQRPRVYFESIHRRMKTFAPTSLAIFALQAAGGVNAAPDAASVRGTNIAAYGKERILALAKVMDVYLAQQGTMNRVSRADITGEPGFAALRAVRQGRVHLIDEQLVSRPGPRLLEGIRAIQAILYPHLARAAGSEARP